VVGRRRRLSERSISSSSGSGMRVKAMRIGHPTCGAKGAGRRRDRVRRSGCSTGRGSKCNRRCRRGGRVRRRCWPRRGGRLWRWRPARAGMGTEGGAKVKWGGRETGGRENEE
jgi:hypothetical protein